MPQNVPASVADSQRCSPKRRGKTLSLPVVGTFDVGGHHSKVKRSRASWWRAVILTLVHVVIAVHICLWFVSGLRDGVRTTVSPVEPSESMYTLENGIVNAGFLFFALAILATLVLGRFVCGWGCHIIALQDLCSWLMKKIGLRPKPFRSRLLMLAPLVLALYMFVWPTFKREVLYRLTSPEQRASLAPWIGDSAPFPGWSNGLMVEDFWKTFPPIWVIPPFIFACCFALVYFLGNKAFCTYGCPYGGFFAPADLLAPGKIRVTDACEGCGHCTAVCSSNVRVHEEVRDFGAVVDPGCMKCMDCVSVCPNEALYFGFGAPTLLTKPRDTDAAARVRTKNRNPRSYDLTRAQDLFFGLVFLLFFMAFRGFWNQVPLLMAMALGAMAAYFAWVLWRLIREPNYRIHNWQLKLKGSWRPAGMLAALAAVLYLAVGAWGGYVRANLYWADGISHRVSVPAEVAMSPGYVPPEEAKQDALAAIAAYRRAGPPARGGLGWPLRPEELLQTAYLNAVCGNLQQAEADILEIVDRGRPQDQLMAQLVQIMRLRGASDDEVFATLDRAARLHPQLRGLRAALAVDLVKRGRQADATALYDRALETAPADVITLKDYGMLLAQIGHAEKGNALLDKAAQLAGEHPMRRNAEALRQVGRAMVLVGRFDPALAAFRRAADMDPALRQIHQDLAYISVQKGDIPGAIAELRLAADADPDDPNPPAQLADLYTRQGNAAEAATWSAKAQAALQRLQQQQQQPVLPVAPAAPSGHP